MPADAPVTTAMPLGEMDMALDPSMCAASAWVVLDVSMLNTYARTMGNAR
jgi:hypothetical protein